MWLERLKYPDAPHWWHEAQPAGSDEFGDWFEVPAGTPYHQVDQVVVQDVRSRVLIPHRGWWMARYLDSHPNLDLYVDIVGPRTVSGDRVFMVDFDLDVIRWCDGRAPRVQLVDEDEFAVHSVNLSYPPGAISDARAAADWVLDAGRRELPPFDTTTFARARC